MLLSEHIISAMENWGEDISGISVVEIKCAKDQAEEIFAFFKTTFKEEWENAAKSQYGEDTFDEDGVPEKEVYISQKDDGFNILFEYGSLGLRLSEYEEDSFVGIDALKAALERVIQKYSSLHYKAAVQFVYSGSDVMRQFLSSEDVADYRKGEKIHHVGQELAAYAEDEEFWEKLSEKLSDETVGAYKEAFFDFYCYKEMMEDFDAVVERLIEIADENEDDESNEALSELKKRTDNNEEIKAADIF